VIKNWYKPASSTARNKKRIC